MTTYTKQTRRTASFPKLGAPIILLHLKIAENNNMCVRNPYNLKLYQVSARVLSSLHRHTSRSRFRTPNLHFHRVLSPTELHETLWLFATYYHTTNHQRRNHHAQGTVLLSIWQLQSREVVQAQAYYEFNLVFESIIGSSQAEVAKQPAGWGVHTEQTTGTGSTRTPHILTRPGKSSLHIRSDSDDGDSWLGPGPPRHVSPGRARTGITCGLRPGRGYWLSAPRVCVRKF